MRLNLPKDRRRGVCLSDLSKNPWATMRLARERKLLPLVTSIGDSEKEVVALGLESTDPLLELDDRIARRHAIAAGRATTGTLVSCLLPKERQSPRRRSTHIRRSSESALLIAARFLSWPTNRPERYGADTFDSSKQGMDVPTPQVRGVVRSLLRYDCSQPRVQEGGPEETIDIPVRVEEVGRHPHRRAAHADMDLFLDERRKLHVRAGDRRSTVDPGSYRARTPPHSGARGGPACRCRDRARRRRHGGGARVAPVFTARRRRVFQLLYDAPPCRGAARRVHRSRPGDRGCPRPHPPGACRDDRRNRRPRVLSRSPGGRARAHHLGLSRRRTTRLWPRTPALPAAAFARLKAALLAGGLITYDVPYALAVDAALSAAGPASSA